MPMSILLNFSPPGYLLRPLVLALLVVVAVGPWPAPSSNAVSQGRPGGRIIKQPELQGKTIRNITIKILPVFEGDDLSFLYDTANSIKIQTKQSLIKNELRFEEGQPYDEFTIRETERQIRALRFLREVWIEGTPQGDFVDIEVHVQDTWTFIPLISFNQSSGSSKRTFGVADGNMLGYGIRGEILEESDNGRQSVETALDDPRLFSSYNRGQIGYFDRNDGQRFVFLLSRPFLSFLDRTSWAISAEDSDVVGRLFEAGDEDYIFRRSNRELRIRYTLARGTPDTIVTRYSFGFDTVNEQFAQATADDYESLDLDPNEVSNSVDRLAPDRSFTGPLFGLQRIEPDFIAMNYIDRFDRVEDYNLGNEFSFTLFGAPAILGSRGDSLQFSGNRSFGHRFSSVSFLRFEAGGSTRVYDQELQNSLIRGEVKYYNVLGSCFLGDAFFGRHTLAGGLSTDIGDSLDPDRQFLLGADSGLRGYQRNTLTGDKRFLLNLEDRIHLYDDVLKILSIGAVGFFDVGGATYGSLGNLLSKDAYPSVGVGLRLGFPRSTSSGVVRFDVALPLRDSPDGEDRLTPVFTISAGQAFSSRVRSETLGPEKANVEVGFDR